MGTPWRLVRKKWIRVRHRHGYCASLLGVLLATSPAGASPSAVLVDVRAGRLVEALNELARENGVEILFEDSLFRDQRTKALAGRVTIKQALSTLLAGTGMTYRVSPDGAFVLVRLPQQAPVDTSDGAISEVLVIGRQTQNADIRRTRNDIQPYIILGPRELSLLQHDNLDQLARGRLPANTQAASPGQGDIARTATTSAINLRGVGAQRTLVLIDGRRLPGLPTVAAGLDQSDLNALPLGAIERIETLTAAAGGIHGPGALGGAVNIVLRRDYRGADLTVVSGLTDRGDASRFRLEGRLGFTPDGGITDVMLVGAYAKSEPLTADRRDFARRALYRESTEEPSGFLSRGPNVNAVIVRSLSGRPLQLDAAAGGAPLASAYSFLPLDFTGDAQRRAAALVANAGNLPTDPPRGGAGSDTTLLAGAELGSGLINVRRQLWSGVEAFVDGLYLTNTARGSVPTSPITSSVHADALSNPFTESVAFTFPASALHDDRETRVRTHRLTVGLIGQLSRRWKGSADYTMGASSLETIQETSRLTTFPATFAYGIPGPGGLPPIFPLADGATLAAATAAYTVDTIQTSRITDRFQSLSLRAAGPLVELPNGPLTLTLLGEARREHMPEGGGLTIFPDRTTARVTPDRTQVVHSAYVELRAPLVPRTSPIIPLRGLEVQIALRRDAVWTTFPENVLSGAEFREGETTIRHRANVFTVGGRLFPASWLMVRASTATGEAPPDLRHLQERAVPVNFDNPGEPADPQRGGRRITQDGPYLWVRGGSHDIGQEKGSTTSLGLVLNPEGRSGPRLSIDFSRIDVRDEIIAFALSLQQLLNAETQFPDLVVREALSATDKAQGYSAGRVTALRTGLINGGRTFTEAMDVQLDWSLPPTRHGQAHIYGAATWQPRFRVRDTLGAPLIDRTGYNDAPLKWLGHAGVEWTSGPLAIDLDVQFMDDRREAPATSLSALNAANIRATDAKRIPAQAYVDLAVRRTFDLPAGRAARAIDIRAGVQNLFDRSPPILANANGVGYDFQGDPRRRRFQVMLSARF